jgi:hypothetical protein
VRSRRWVGVATDVWQGGIDVGGQGTPRLNTSEDTSMFEEKKDDGQDDGSLVGSDVIDVFLVRAKGLNTWAAMFNHAKNRSKPKNEQQREQIRRTPPKCCLMHLEVRTRTDCKQSDDDSSSTTVPAWTDCRHPMHLQR